MQLKEDLKELVACQLFLETVFVIKKNPLDSKSLFHDKKKIVSVVKLIIIHTSNNTLWHPGTVAFLDLEHPSVATS